MESHPWRSQIHQALSNPISGNLTFSGWYYLIQVFLEHSQLWDVEGVGEDLGEVIFQGDVLEAGVQLLGGVVGGHQVIIQNCLCYLLVSWATW